MGKPMDIVYIPDENGNFMPTRVPTWIGFIGFYAGLEPPEGYLYCDGSAIGRETYSELFEAVGTLYGAGDGVSTFELPDARGVFFRGDGGENSAAMGTRQGDAIRNITGGVNYRPARWNNNDELVDFVAGTGVGAIYVDDITTDSTNTPLLLAATELKGEQRAHFDASRVVPTAAEVRPINLAMKPCIRYI